MSYSRHAVHDDHLATAGSNPLVNFKVCKTVYLFICLFVCLSVLRRMFRVTIQVLSNLLLTPKQML